MKIIGLLSWYDESPSWLAATVASFAPVLDHLIAVDGAYGSFPGGRARSDLGQAETIMRTADAVGLGVTVHQPSTVFWGNEVEKRSLMFSLGLAQAELWKDWFWVIDGDEVLTKAPSDLRTRLQYIERLACEVTLWTQDHWNDLAPDAAQMMKLPPISRHAMRMLFRAIPDLTVRNRHDIYVGTDPDGEPLYLWGPQEIDPVIAEPLPEVEVEHRSTKRDAARRASSLEYYKIREALGLERINRTMFETLDGNFSEVR